MLTNLNGRISMWKAANFCAVTDTLVDQDEVEVANFCAVMDTLVDHDGLNMTMPVKNYQ